MTLTTSAVRSQVRPRVWHDQTHDTLGTVDSADILEGMREPQSLRRDARKNVRNNRRDGGI
jgi:hypothetical protein